MTATKSTAPKDAKAPVNKDIEIVYEEKLFPTAGDNMELRQVPSGKMTPVVLVPVPITLTERIDQAFRYAVKYVCKRHDRNGKTYYEVGESDDAMEQAIQDAIEVLKSLGIQAKRSVEFSPYLHRREW